MRVGKSVNENVIKPIKSFITSWGGKGVAWLTNKASRHQDRMKTASGAQDGQLEPKDLVSRKLSRSSSQEDQRISGLAGGAFGREPVKVGNPAEILRDGFSYLTEHHATTKGLGRISGAKRYASDILRDMDSGKDLKDISNAASEPHNIITALKDLFPHGKGIVPTDIRAELASASEIKEAGPRKNKMLTVFQKLDRGLQLALMNLFELAIRLDENKETTNMDLANSARVWAQVILPSTGNFEQTMKQTGENNQILLELFKIYSGSSEK